MIPSSAPVFLPEGGSEHGHCTKVSNQAREGMFLPLARAQ